MSRITHTEGAGLWGTHKKRPGPPGSAPVRREVCHKARPSPDPAGVPGAARTHPRAGPRRSTADVRDIGRTPRMTHVRRRRLLAVLLIGQFMANIDIALVNVAGAAIRGGLRASGGALVLVVSGYTLAYAVLLVTGARLGDTHNYQRMYQNSQGGFTLASLACGPAKCTW